MWLINIPTYLKSMQFLSLCKNPHYVIHVFAYDILETWTPRAVWEEFYLPWDHVNSQKPTLCQQNCFAKPPLLENRGRLSVAPLRGQGEWSPGVSRYHMAASLWARSPQGLLQDHLYPPPTWCSSKLVPHPLYVLWTWKEKNWNILAHPQLTTQEKELLPTPRLHSSPPPAVSCAHPTNTSLCPRRTISFCDENNWVQEQEKTGQDLA